ncbi:MAG: YchF-related putative GTPase [archaeon]
MTILIGIVGKPSSGKSTFLNAACLTEAETSIIPFTTIDPNKGVSYVRTQCVCKELGVEDNPKNSICKNGIRFIPVNLLDVAGLVPDAHKGKGLGNKFLNDLSRADVLIHIVDITGSLDSNGQRIGVGKTDPLNDIKFLEKEINLWFKEILEREDWEKFKRTFKKQRTKFINGLFDRLSGLKIKKIHIKLALRKSQLNSRDPIDWDQTDLLKFTTELRKIAKPIVVIANKIDKISDPMKLKGLQEKYNGVIIPSSALAELYLRKYEEQKRIKYLPGSGDFQFLKEESFSKNELTMLKKIKNEILKKYGGTGVQSALNYAVFEIMKQICVFPVSNVNNYSDKNGNVLPDAFLIEEGLKLRNFVEKKIHSDLAKNFLFGIDARTKKRLGENYELKDKDIIKIVTSN